MKKRNYEKPSMKVVLLNKQPQLLAGSNYSAGFGGYYSAGTYLDGDGLDNGGNLE